jgi:hypothetical protein
MARRSLSAREAEKIAELKQRGLFRDPGDAVEKKEIAVHMCEVAGCTTWGCYGRDDAWRCRTHVWPGFLPGSVS